MRKHEEVLSEIKSLTHESTLLGAEQIQLLNKTIAPFLKQN
jgi:hypothetical protein